MSEDLLDCLGRRRSPAATSAFHTGRPPGNRGLHYPPTQSRRSSRRCWACSSHRRSAAAVIVSPRTRCRVTTSFCGSRSRLGQRALCRAKPRRLA